MTTALRQAALDAATATAQANRDKRATERDNALTVLLEKWADRATLSYKGEPLPKPAREAFSWTPYPGFPYGYSGTVHGWTWETDEITFVYDASYSGAGLCVVLQCPECGERHADHVYGLDGLGRALRNQRATSHECHAIAVKSVALAINRAARTTGLHPSTIASQALELDAAWPR